MDCQTNMTTMMNFAALLAKRYDGESACFQLHVVDRISRYTIDPVLVDAMSQLVKFLGGLQGLTQVALAQSTEEGADPVFTQSAEVALAPFCRSAHDRACRCR